MSPIQAPPSDGLLDRDAARLWHPYSTAGARSLYAVRGADGVRLRLEDDDGVCRTAIDAMGSWWSVIHGHGHPRLVEAITAQARAMPHVMFGGLTHTPAVELAEELVRITPPGLEQVFLADSGSVSVEVAVKAALQHQAARSARGRRRLLALRGGYHGDTSGAMGLCDPVDGMHRAFSGLVADHLFAPRPPSARYQPAAGSWETDQQAMAEWADGFRRLVAEHADQMAGVILEPVLQGAGGMHIWSPEVLRIIRQVCDEHSLLLIADEIATGFGRTGRLFACDWAGVRPDILCVGKALTGGTMTGAAMLCTRDVAETVSRADHGMPGVLLHGPTFMGNPLFCAAALASLQLLADPDDGWRNRVPAVEAGLREGLRPAEELNSVRDVRVLGAVGVVELDVDVDLPAVTRAAVARGVWVRPFRRLVYVMPPYVCTADELAELTAGVVAAVAEVHG